MARVHRSYTIPELADGAVPTSVFVDLLAWTVLPAGAGAVPSEFAVTVNSLLDTVVLGVDGNGSPALLVVSHVDKTDRCLGYLRYLPKDHHLVVNR